MKRLLCLLTLAGLISSPAVCDASHFRGGALVPSIDAQGVLNVTATTFWRKGSADDNPLTVNGSSIGPSVTSVDTSDARYDVRNQTFSTPLTGGAQTAAIRMASFARVSSNINGGNWLESDWDLDSAIVWDGQSAANPIDFNFASVQPEVSRLNAYSQNLNAVSPDGLGLSYDQNLNLNITAQPTPGFNIDSNGTMTISVAETPLVMDHQSPANIGADKAFSGNIRASDGSSVEFDWMFDGVDALLNRAPDVSNMTLIGNVGDLFDYTFTATDPDGDAVTFDSALFGILGNPLLQPTYDPLTGRVTWNSAGSGAPNLYRFQVRGSDPFGLTDVGTLTIDLRQGGGMGNVPEPASLLVWGSLIACGGVIRKRRR